MGAFKDILTSEKGLIGVLLIIGITVLACLDKVSFAAWQDYTLWIFGIYVTGKTVQGAVTSITDAKREPPPAPPLPPAPTPS